MNDAARHPLPERIALELLDTADEPVGESTERTFEEVDPQLALVRNEAFGPVAILSSFRDFEAALDDVNDSVFGLQAGVFTRDIYRAEKAFDRLYVGGVVVGDVPSWRVDHMPYGGVKDSGLGREGIRFAIEDMTEIKLFVLRTPRIQSN